MPNARPVKDRLFERLIISDSGCWEYVGCRLSTGYGTIGERKNRHLTHRLSWMLHVGPIPLGLLVLHKCNNPPCCNPKHLYLGNHDDNMAQCVAQGRNYRGGRPKTSKINLTFRRIPI